MMGEIRKVDPARDAREIAEIYRWYVENTTATFELIPLSEGEMLLRIEDIASGFPYYVWEEGGNILGFLPVSRFRNVGKKFGRLLDVADYQKIIVQSL